MLLYIFLFLFSLRSAEAVPEISLADSLRSQARIHLDSERPKDAASTLRSLEKLGLAKAQDYVWMGKIYLLVNDRGKAKRAYQKAIRGGSEAAGYHGIGMVYKAMGTHAHLALVNFRRALWKDPEFVHSQYEIAEVYRTLRPLEAEVAYRRTISMDNTHPDAYFRLGELLEQEGRLAEAKSAYRQQIESNPSHGFASLNLGKQVYLEGQKAEAARIFTDLVDAGGEVETASYLEMALMSHDAKDFDRSQRLFEAYIGRLPEEERGPFTDIEHVASREDLDILNQTPAGQRAEMRRRYWARLDPAPLSMANERLLEHYRRVAFAKEKYAKGEDPFDERGRAHVRLGMPDHVSRSDDISSELEPALIQARQNFVSRTRLGVEVRPGLPAYPVEPGARWEYWVYAGVDNGIELTFTSLFSDGKYRFASVPSTGSLRSINELLSTQGDQVVGEVRRRSPSRYKPDFADLPIDFYYYPAAFRGDADKTRLELYVGLPADDVARVKRDEDELIVFDRAVALHDSTWAEVHRVTDQLVFRAPSDQEVDAGAFIPGLIPVHLEPGDYWMSLQIRDRVSGKSQVYKQAIHLDDYSSRDTLQISDIELAFHVGQSSEDGEFTKDGLKIIPLSSKAFRRDQNAFVYFEIYNLERDTFGQTSYKVEYTIRSHTERSVPAKILRGIGRIMQVVEGEQEVKVSFEQTGDRVDDSAYVELDITESRPGGQMVKVKVTDLQSERSAEKSIRFSVDAF